MNFIGEYIAIPVYAQAASPMGMIDVIARIINIIILVSGAVFIGYVMMSAYKFATSEGDPKGVQGAKQSLTYAVFGLCVVVGAFAINVILVGIISPSNPSDLTTPQTLFQSIRDALGDIMRYAGITGY